MLSCDQLTQDDLVVLHNIILQQQDEINALKKHVSFLLDDLQVCELNKKGAAYNEKAIIELKLEVEKLRREKAKLKLEKEGTYINPGQRKYTSQQSLMSTKPVTPGTRTSPHLVERRNTGGNRDVTKVKTLDDRDMRHFINPASPTGTLNRAATLQRPPTSNTPVSNATSTPSSLQTRQRNKGLFASMSRAMHKVRRNRGNKKSISDPNLSALETGSEFSKDGTLRGSWLKNIFGTNTVRYGRTPSTDGSRQGDYTLLQLDKSRTMYPCMLGINTLEEVVTAEDLEEVDFANWETWKLHQWMDTQGLGIFGQKLPAGWTGANILKLDIAGLEQLGIKHPLHVKKLVLALRNAGQEDTPGSLHCDTWVLPWLTEIGLPQHVPAFREAMVDGRVLNWLTYEDLRVLKVRLRLHAVSIMRAIELLRECNFDPNYLNSSRIDNTTRPAEVMYWTHQNVKQWLSSNYFAEYTPALKESGIHGALIIKEPLITSAFLLKLLKIPHSEVTGQMFETIFNKLVGPHVLLEKRLAETDKNVKPLSTQTKLSKSFKGRRSLQNSLSRRKRKESSDEWLTYVVPFSEEPEVPAIELSYETKEEISGIQREVQNLTVLLSGNEEEDEEEDPLSKQ